MNRDLMHINQSIKLGYRAKNVFVRKKTDLRDSSKTLFRQNLFCLTDGFILFILLFFFFAWFYLNHNGKKRKRT
jgi:hypothetical protein